MIVAIDGPSGAGKSTLAKGIAKELGLTYLDTGAMYRALALKVLREHVNSADEQNVGALVATTNIDLVEQDGKVEVLLDGVNVSGQIRTPEVSQMASKVSALRVVRQRLLELQRRVAKHGSVVAEGRDIGTVVFPRADVKVYIDASVQERARRRFKELHLAGREVTLTETLREIEERDQRDSERDLAPLRKAEDAVVIDSSALSADAVRERVMIEIRKKRSKNT